MAAALLHPFNKCIGIELLKGLFDLSLRVQSDYESQREVICREFPDLYPQIEDLPDLEYLLGSFFDVDWSDSSLILANSTCFSQDMMQRIARRPVPLDTFAITLSRSIGGGNWDLLDSFRRPMSWGEATIYLHKRVS